MNIKLSKLLPGKIYLQGVRKLVSSSRENCSMKESLASANAEGSIFNIHHAVVIFKNYFIEKRKAFYFNIHLSLCQ